MESNKIKASIIIPVYNTKKYVRQTVKSIMNQTLKELEIIIINDGSTDESLKIVEELLQFCSNSWYQECLSTEGWLWRV